MSTTCHAVAARRRTVSALAFAASLGVLASQSLPAVALAKAGQVGSQPGSGFHTQLSSAMRYVMNYEQQFALLVSEEHYQQELLRPTNPGDNLSRTNPGGGMRAGGSMNVQAFKADFILVQLGMDGEGWMPFRDAYEVKGKKLRKRDDRMLKLFLDNDKQAFEKAARLNEASAKHHLGNVARTINIPTLGMMLLHPRVNERFEFIDGGEENIGGRIVRKALYREMARPTIIKTTRGRDLALSGAIWIDPFSGAVVKTEMNAADPAVRCQVIVTFRRDDTLEMWVPEKMDEYYKATLAVDDIFASATYSNIRRYRRSDFER